MTPFNIIEECEGLSFAARAVLAVVAALVVEHNHDRVPARDIRKCLGLGLEAWESARDELYEADRLYKAHDPSWSHELVSPMAVTGLLCHAIGAGGRPRAKDWSELTAQVFYEQGSECLYCSATATTVDHIVPVAKGGSNHIANLVAACKSCNSAKGTRSFEEFWPLSVNGRSALR